MYLRGVRCERVTASIRHKVSRALLVGCHRRPLPGGEIASPRGIPDVVSVGGIVVLNNT